MAALMNKRILLAHRPEGMPKPDDFRIEEAPIPTPEKGEVLLRISPSTPICAGG
jgi:NADPH-dependent curcumin reductase